MARQDKAARHKDMPGNQTANTPEVNESELAALKMDELRDRAKDLGVSGTSGMRKEQLVNAVAKASTGSGGKGQGAGGGRGDGGGGVRRGPESSKSLRKATATAPRATSSAWRTRDARMHDRRAGGWVRVTEPKEGEGERGGPG